MYRKIFGLVVFGLFSCGEVHKEGPVTSGQIDPNNPEAALEAGGVLRMAWLGEGKKPLEGQLRDRSCRSPYEFQSLQYGESLWVACEPGEVFYGGVLTRLDPNKKEAQSFWQFPQMLPLGEVRGLAPLPDEQLAVLYSLGGSQKETTYAIAITRADGWALPPMEIGNPGEPLGFSWNQGLLELVVSNPKGSESSAAATIISYTVDGKRSERAVTLQCAEPSTTCAPFSAYLRPTEKTWRFLVDERRSVPNLREHKEDGSAEEGALTSDGMSEDLSVSGILNRRSSIKNRLLADGKVAPHPEAPRGVANELYDAHSNRYRVEDGRLSTYCLWEMVGSRATLQSVNGRLLYTDLLKKNGMLAIVDATNPSQPKEKQVGPIAGKLFRWRCTDLSEGSFVAKKNGGYWLIGENGCYVDLPGVW